MAEDRCKVEISALTGVLHNRFPGMHCFTRPSNNDNLKTDGKTEAPVVFPFFIVFREDNGRLLGAEKGNTIID